MTLSDIVVYTCLIVFVLFITKVNNMWGVSKGTTKARIDVKQDRKTQKKRLQRAKFLEKAEWFARNVGLEPSQVKLQDYKFRISRLHWTVKYLDRELKPLELIGLMRMVMFAGASVGVLGYILTQGVFFIFFSAFLFLPMMVNIYADMKISDEDKELERDFPDLYLLIYSRLVQGTHVRLAPVLQDYLYSLDAMYGEDHKSVIKDFVLDFRGNIEIYGDDSMAVMKLREKYTSVMIVNFTNLAVQALRGVDNKDKLLSFKVELSQQRIASMEERADKLVARGSRAILVVYAILFQFIFLSWTAKFKGVGDVWSILGF